MKHLFDSASIKTSKMVTNTYSTSFSLGIKFLNKEFQDPIYSIYGFVRFADEIVDTFHDFNKRELLDEFKLETYRAIERGISLNPVLNSFQKVVNDFKIDVKLIDTFLKSMEMDLEKKDYDFDGYKEYILGSAEVVGLMCLRVFVKGNQKMYDDLTPYAMSLGSAFQKINFLRDLNADYIGMGRIYFPNVDIQKLNDETKASIEKDIEANFEMGLQGIKMLPKKARLGVYVAYIYYNSLFKKIKKLKASNIIEERIRIPNPKKIALFAGSYLRNSFNML
jgi:phytoene/squalene synthetase